MYLIEKERKNRVLPLKSLRQEVTNITSLLLHWWNLVLWPHQNTKASRNVCGPTAVNQKKAYTRKGGAWIFEQLNISAIELDLVGQFLTELPWIWALAIIGTQEWPIHGMKDLNWITYLMILQKKKTASMCSLLLFDFFNPLLPDIYFQNFTQQYWSKVYWALSQTQLAFFDLYVGGPSLSDTDDCFLFHSILAFVCTCLFFSYFFWTFYLRPQPGFTFLMFLNCSCSKKINPDSTLPFPNLPWMILSSCD